MIPEITFPKHTQARMAAAKAAKDLNSPKKAETDQPRLATASQTLPGVFKGLSVDARTTILQSDANVVIGYGTLNAFITLAKDVNLAMLDHYMPHIVAEHKHATLMGDVVLLPDDMSLVTERGLKYVLGNMKRELEWGSYATSHFTKNKNDRATCMIRPCRNPVDMIHGLNTLRTFGLEDDAKFLAMLNGPIMTSLQRRATEWNGSLWGLKRFLNTLSRELLVEEDRRLLAPAWAVYGERARDQPRSKTSGHKA